MADENKLPDIEVNAVAWLTLKHKDGFMFVHWEAITAVWLYVHGDRNDWEVEVSGETYCITEDMAKLILKHEAMVPRRRD